MPVSVLRTCTNRNRAHRPMIRRHAAAGGSVALMALLLLLPAGYAQERTSAPAAGTSALPPGPEADPTAADPAGPAAQPAGGDPLAAPGLSPAAAAPRPVQIAEPAAEVADAGWAGTVLPLIKTVGAIGFVLCLLLGGLLTFRKIAPQYFRAKPAERTVHLVDSLSLGDKRSIAVIEVDRHRYLIGNTPTQVTLLASLGGDEAPGARPREIAAAVQPPPASRPGFRSVLNSRRNGSQSAPPSLPPDIRGKMQELRKALES